MSNSLKLNPRQRRLYDLLLWGATECTEPDVSILTCYSTVYAGVYDENRVMQQKLGPFILRINRHLAKIGQHIEPGDHKRTYRLNLDYKG